MSHFGKAHAIDSIPGETIFHESFTSLMSQANIWFLLLFSCNVWEGIRVFTHAEWRRSNHRCRCI